LPSRVPSAFTWYLRSSLLLHKYSQLSFMVMPCTPLNGYTTVTRSSNRLSLLVSFNNNTSPASLRVMYSPPTGAGYIIRGLPNPEAATCTCQPSGTFNSFTISGKKSRCWGYLVTSVDRVFFLGGNPRCA
jgi:hypothetical protein